MRTPNANDFKLHVEGIGDFIFARRTLGDQLSIRREFLRLLGGTPTESDRELTWLASAIAEIKVLCVAAPVGWDAIENLDLISDPGSLDKFARLYMELGRAEDSFRDQTIRTSPSERQGAGKDSPVLVPEEVQPASE